MSYVSRIELRNAYEDCIKKKRGTQNASLFEVDDSVKLEYLYRDLNTMQYKISKSIVFVLDNNKGVPYREVFAADFRDRIVHHLLINRILPEIEEYGFIEDSYACRKNKGVLYGVNRLQEKLIEASNNGEVKEMYILKGDFKNCFNSIDKNILFSSMSKFISKYMSNDKNLIFNLYLLKLIIYHCPNKEGNYIRKQNINKWNGLKPEKSMFNLDDFHGIAIGNLTSQIFVNFLLSIFDKYIIEILGVKCYGRYVDDFYLIGYNKENLLKAYIKICDFANEIGMQINKDKFYLQHYKKGVKFIGYFVYYNRIYITNTVKHKIYKMFHNINTFLNEIGDRDLTIEELNQIMPSWNSYMGILKHVKSFKLLQKITNKYPNVIITISKVASIDRFFVLHYKK